MRRNTLISILNVRSESHNSCEDSVIVMQDCENINGIISDGCSTGVNSHFASQAICYAFKEVGGKYDSFTEDVVIASVRSRLLALMATLGLDGNPQLLATCVLFNYNTKTKTLRIRVLGDAYYYIDDVEFIVDQNNIPDYIGYHLDEGPINFSNYISKYPEKVYENVNRFVICSDGIKRIERGGLQPNATLNPDELLFHPPLSSNYLQRMWNLIKRDGFKLSDDLTIVSYVS